jgi:hypothetical protein
MRLDFPLKERSAPLTEGTQARLAILFPSGPAREEAAWLLVEECGNDLPFLEKLDPAGLERCRFAALKLSGGSLVRLREAVDLAKTDWRDLLMAAGFGDDVHAHQSWTPERKA